MNDECNPNKCSYIDRLERRIETLRTQNTETHKRMWEVINELKTNDAVQITRYDTILSQLNSVVAEVKALQAVPGNNWKDLMKSVGTSIATLILGILAAKMGLV